ncbi:hypothetical protein M0R72_11575 [Candidatus Pacearchaeota archaeon]|jgi:hypothetical protein|nr:hypothetical protein [Candidatus Pacearchaeota archaeon]
MRNWLIRKLGGMPLPKVGYCKYLEADGNYLTVGIEGNGRDDMIRALGGVPLPKAGEGQYLRSPAVCKMPVRKPKTLDEALAPVREALAIKLDAEIMSLPEQPANLCDACGASAQDCRKAVKETDSENNTVKCTEYK